ncbi:rhodanese-like domain-containing protein [Rhizobium sp. LEGMi135b]
MSLVSDIPAAAPSLVAEHYAQKLAFETDCSDVHQSMTSGNVDFVLLDVRGPAMFQEQHIPGALNLPYGKMTARKMAEWPDDTLFVVYCAGPHCNGTDKAALRLGTLGKRVKVMIGGITGWADEDYPFEVG